jgi:hypothetical protein
MSGKKWGAQASRFFCVRRCQLFKIAACGTVHHAPHQKEQQHRTITRLRSYAPYRDRGEKNALPVELEHLLGGIS